MTIKLELVREKKGFLNHFTFPKILGIFILLISLPTFFILPFFKKNSVDWIIPYFICLSIIFILSWIIMHLKYYTTYDYECIGSLILTDEKLIISLGTEEKKIYLETNRIKFLYNGIRNKGFHFGRDYPRSGIFEIIINDYEKFYSIIKNDDDLDLMKKLLKIWYRNNFDIQEFTRNPEEYRLIELEMNFDWSRLNEIKNINQKSNYK
jgi:hypothetical protein